MSKRIKIEDFRGAIRCVNYVRNDFSSQAGFERLSTNLRSTFNNSTQIVSDMIPLVGQRFKDDIEDANKALLRAKAQIERNESAQRDAIKNKVSGTIFNPDAAKPVFLKIV